DRLTSFLLGPSTETCVTCHNTFVLARLCLVSPSVCRPFRELAAETRRGLRFVLADIDDTLTSDGRLGAAAYAALERLTQAGLAVIPVTGRPAGWCDLIARFWPVAAVIGENGAFYFRYDRAARRMSRGYWQDAAARRRGRRRLQQLGDEILAAVP